MASKPHLTEVSTADPGPEIAAAENRGLGRFVRGLRRRKVCRTAISYMLVMWLNLQIGDVIFPMIGLPDWALSLIIVIGVMGFPVVLIVSWAFQITPEGIVLDAGEARESGVERQLDTTVNLLLLMLAIALSVLLLLQFFSADRPLTYSPAESPGVVITSLSITATPDLPDSRMLAAAIEEALRHRLIALDGVELLPPAPASPDLPEGGRVALAGSLLLEGDTAHLIVHLIDLEAGRYRASLAFDVPTGSILEAERAGADRIIAAFRDAFVRSPT